MEKTTGKQMVERQKAANWTFNKLNSVACSGIPCPVSLLLICPVFWFGGSRIGLFLFGPERLQLEDEDPLKKTNERIHTVGGVVDDSLAGHLQLKVGHGCGLHLVLRTHILRTHQPAKLD